MAGLLFAVPALSNTGPPTISSDQADYAPGSTVTLTGSNWQPGEAVHISVNDNVGQTWSYSADVTADAGGAYTNQFQLPTSFVASYLVTATGLLSGTATTTFTDSAAGLDQCVNGGVGDTPEPCVNNTTFNSNWGNGDANGQKAHWGEDEFLPYRATVDGITAGGHTLTIQYDTVHSSLHALDYLGSFDATETTSSIGTTLHANNNDPCFDVLTGSLASECTPGTPADSEHIPNPTLANCGGSLGTPPLLITGSDSDRQMKIWGPTGTGITGMTYVDQNVDQGGGQCATSLRISFAVGGTATSNTVVLAWAGHIARGDGYNGWGAGYGAGSLSGSPYHMAFDTTEGLDGASQGQQDHQLRAGPPNGAIIPSSTITIIKHTAGGDDTFHYTTTGGGGLPPTFNITTSGGAGQQVNSGINPGTYTVTESSPPSGWSFTTLTCTSPTTGVITSTSGPQATITIPNTGGASVTCTYTNTRAATVEVIKSLVPSTDSGKFNLQVNGVTKATDVGDGGTTNAVQVPAGSSPTVGEVAGTDTSLSDYESSIACTGDSSATASNGGPLSVGTLNAGQSATCTITNKRKPWVKVIKSLVPSSDSGRFNLQVNGVTKKTDAGNGDDTGQVNVAVGSNPTVGEVAGSVGQLSDYESSIACTGDSSATASNGGPLSVGTLNAGQSATCTITNKRKPWVKVIKSLVPSNDSGRFNLQVNGVTKKTDAGNGDDTGQVNVAVGSNPTVGEVAGSVGQLSDYESSIACTGDSSATASNGGPLSVGTLNAGQSATCTITNSRRPQLKVIKTFVGDTSGRVDLKIDNATYGNSGNGFGTTNVGTDFQNVSTGAHVVAEVAHSSATDLSNYDKSISCDYSKGSNTGQTSLTTAALAYGDKVTCTITNSRLPTLTVIKHVVTDNGGTATADKWSMHIKQSGVDVSGKSPFPGAESPGVTKTLTPGTFYVSETGGPFGYAFDGYSGNCDSSGAVTLAYGDNKTCTLTNNDQPGTIVIIKNATPTQGVFSFDTTGSTNGPGTSWPTGLAAFTLSGSTANNGNRRTFTVDAGTYTVKEQTQLGWLLTGIGGSTDPLHPYDCVVTGSGGSTGGGVAQSPQTPLDTRTVSLAIKNGDAVTCTFENTGNGATRTQGFWATHPQLANIAWLGGSEFGHTFPGVAGTVGNLSIDGATPCPRLIDTLGKLMGGFWSSVSTKSNGSKRSALDQARMQLAQQLLAAELNTSAFGSAPTGGVASFTTWESAFCGTNQNAIKNAQQGAASFNSQGDSSTFTPGTSADSKTARSIANIPYWDVLP